MNQLAYLTFFDHLVDRTKGTFTMETHSCDEGESAFSCNFSVDHAIYSAQGPTRKEALQRLYRKIQTFRHKLG